MSVAKVRSYSSVDTMKPGQKVGKPEEGNDSLDSFIRQAIGKEPVLSFSRASDSPVQWIQLLHALDQQGTNKLSKGSKLNHTVEGKEHLLEHRNGVSSFASEMNGVKESAHPIKSSGVPVKGMKSASEHMQTLKIPEAVVAFAQAAAKANGEPEKYLPGWPLLSPPKVQMQKCDKCTREFCSPINYRRHIRVHRRALNIDKDFPKNRDFLGAFWDKLSLDEAKEIVSFKNVTLEEVPGSSIIKALTSFIRKPGFSSLPQVYVKAGAALLDVVQARPSRFPISSQELFSILDDASERTFLCAGTALSMQKFVFDGEAGKIGLEMKNLVACTSFLVEQKLIKAWLADKDAEALRCHKLLVEEEEAAQKRQAELLERRKLKKLRQKEQKAKEQNDGDKADLKEDSPDSLEGVSSSAETSSPLAASNSDSYTMEASTDTVQLLLEPARLLNANEEADARCHSGFDDTNTDLTNCQNVDHRMQQGSGRRHLIVARWPASNLHRGASNGFHSGHVLQMPNLGPVQKHGIHRDQRATSLANGHKVWTRKTKPGNEGEDLNARVQREVRDQPDLSGNCEVLIGSISVSLGDCSGQRNGAILASALDQCAFDHQPPRQNNVQEKPIRPDSGQSSTIRSKVKLWRPVGRQEAGNSNTLQNKKEAEVDTDSSIAADQSLNESCLTCGPDNGSASSRVDSSTVVVEGAGPRGASLFCSRDAEAFLTQRWKEAIATDHVKLVLSSLDTELQGGPEIHDEVQIATQVLVDGNRGILCSAENWLSDAGLPEPAIIGVAKAKFRAKPEKGSRLKYIPKQRNHT